MPETPDSPASGVLRSIAVACSPDTNAASALVDLAAAPDVKVRDGDRWTAYATADVSLALAGPTEMPQGATVSLNVKVTDMSAALTVLKSAGAVPCGSALEGEHELRASVWLADSVALTVYQPK